MGQTIIEKIIGAHAGSVVRPGDIVDIGIDVRAARDFGGANVVKNIEGAGLGVADPTKTYFTFDCNPGGSDQGYAANQQRCRVFAENHGVKVHDITQGIGTHIVIEEGAVGPGATFVSTDSHANILGAVGAFGQGMGDQDIAYAWSAGKVWFKVPTSLRVVLKGMPGPHATPKDVVLRMAQELGANGLLGHAAEVEGDYVDGLGLAGRITIASMATEMGGIIALFPPNDAVLEHYQELGAEFTPVTADADAEYAGVVEIDIQDLAPMIARPGHPEDVVPVVEVAGRRVDSVFLGSCTNGRIEDLRAAAEVLQGKRIHPNVVMKVVPATRQVWEQALAEGLVADLMAAGALVGNAGCAGCAAGQIGQNGPGEVTVSTGNRNYAGKQGKGEVYLAKPGDGRGVGLAGVIASADAVPAPREAAAVGAPAAATAADVPKAAAGGDKPTRLTGRVWMVAKDNIDTDMIYHNRHLAVTDQAQMGQYAFGNLPGWEDFPKRVQQGDIVVTAKNFGAGSSRQQAVDCFSVLGVSAIVAESYGAIYERNAINAGLPILVADLVAAGLKDGDEVTIDLETGVVTWDGGELQGQPFSKVQMDIYQRGGLL